MWSEESSWMAWDLSQSLMLSRGEGVLGEIIMNKGASMGKYKVIKGSEAFMDLWIHIKGTLRSILHISLFDISQSSKIEFPAKMSCLYLRGQASCIKRRQTSPARIQNLRDIKQTSQ